MTDGPGQQPPQEPRNDADADGTGRREVLEGRIIPSPTQAQRDADPRRQFRRQSPPPQAPEPGPAWSPEADAAAQAAPRPQTQPGQAWSQEPQQPSLDQGPQPEAAAQVAPAQDWSQPQVPQQPAPPPQGQAQDQPYAAQPQSRTGRTADQPQPPQAQAPAQPYPPHGQAAPQPYPPQGAAPAEQQPYAAQPQGQAQDQPYPPHGQAAPQPYAAQQQAQAPAQAPQPQPQAPAPQAQAPQAQRQPQAPQTPQAPVGRGQRGSGQGGSGQGGSGQGGNSERVPFAGGAAPRPASRARSRARAAEPVPSEPATPDWGALAEQQEATGARRRRVLMLTGGIVAVAVIAGGVATAVVMSGKSDDKPIASPSSSGSSTASRQPLPPEPSFSSVAPPSAANPLDYLNTAAKDKAPISPESLFPGKKFVWEGRTYAKATTDVTTSCAKNARQAVATALTANGCQKLIRATFTQGGLAVTVGVAVFPDNTHAKKVSGVSQYLAPLNGGGVADFCHAVRCQMTANSVGRYAYFAIAGFKDGKTLAANDTAGKQAANDASDFAFSRIVQRGKDAAAADPSHQ